MDQKRSAYADLFRRHVLSPPPEAALMSRKGRPPAGSDNPMIRAVSQNLRAAGHLFEAEAVLRRGGAMTLIEFVTICGDHGPDALRGVNLSSPLARDL